MGEVTRDEIRRAGESVGWVERDEWSMGEQATWWSEPTGLGSVYFASYDDDPVDANGSTLALLEATGCPYTIDRHLRPEPSWTVHIEHPGMGHGTMSGDSLFEAGIRAVVALAESRAELGHA